MKYFYVSKDAMASGTKPTVPFYLVENEVILTAGLCNTIDDLEEIKYFLLHRFHPVYRMDLSFRFALLLTK